MVFFIIHELFWTRIERLLLDFSSNFTWKVKIVPLEKLLFLLSFVWVLLPKSWIWITDNFHCWKKYSAEVCKVMYGFHQREKIFWMFCFSIWNFLQSVLNYKLFFVQAEMNFLLKSLKIQSNNSKEKTPPFYVSWKES